MPTRNKPENRIFKNVSAKLLPYSCNIQGITQPEAYQKSTRKQQEIGGFRESRAG